MGKEIKRGIRKKIGLANIWQSQAESSANKICKMITEM
jgi:hypothetical protein